MTGNTISTPTGTAAAKEALAHVRRTVAESARVMRGEGALRVPDPDVVRAGRAGGLPFDSITTDLYRGCLSLAQTCYGSCFAAKAAYQNGFDFAVRVENIIDRSVLLADLSYLAATQRFLRNGWNSDASWNWPKALQLAEIIRETDRFVVFVTKCFTPIRSEVAHGLAGVGAELRVSVSAFDTPNQLRQRFDALLAYRAAGGIAIPVVMTTAFADHELNDRQDSIVDWVARHDLPGAENSLRTPTHLPVAGLLDKRHVRPLDESGDLWAGRLYGDVLPVPTTASLPADYPGLKFGHLSEIDRDWLESWRHDPVRTHEEVMSDVRFAKPKQAGVAMNWRDIPSSEGSTCR
ncbi:hypothetical protein LRC484719_12700 [Mycobacterium riyadhense]|uniref:Radical SAM protein n=1 Tax=Mycobacterium riyadhense TaxID=486698 RepID=A0A653EFE6_9MYCO|nr:hypothetical protein [Mycobacterium riyadhense]VTO95435.1 hypothetical protein BIN_B_00913 [Mycobacterium riyadhense]